MKRLRPPFYVYEHWRPDKDVCFWVGKGKGRRAYGFKRNKHYNRVVSKLSRLGMCVEVRLVKSGLFQAEAFALEIERIAFWRSCGVVLTNYTKGGDGAAGLKWSKESRRAQKIRQKELMSDLGIRNRIRNKLVGRRLEGTALMNYLAAMALRKGITRGPMTEKQKRKIARAKKGSKATLETRAKMSRARKGFSWSIEVKSKMSASAKVAQKKRRQREMRTKAGREKVKAEMVAMARKGIGTPEYNEAKRRAAFIGWQKRRCISRSIIPGFS